MSPSEIEELVKEIQILKAKIKECEQDSEAYLDSAQHNMEAALMWKKEHEKLTKEVEQLRASNDMLKSILKRYKDHDVQCQKRVNDYAEENYKLRAQVEHVEINDAKLSSRSEGWRKGWEAACYYHELSDNLENIGAY
jgi:chromosome segregation ATPase